MGLILLVRLIVKNGILLLDAAHHASDAGHASAAERQRPPALIGGLVVSTLVTRLIVPVLVELFGALA